MINETINVPRGTREC